MRQICLIYEDLVGEYSLATRLWLFILFQWVAFIFMAGLGATVPDVPEDVTIQQQRTMFLSSKVRRRTPLYPPPPPPFYLPLPAPKITGPTAASCVRYELL